jgi:hypothetical protein
LRRKKITENKLSSVEQQKSRHEERQQQERLKRSAGKQKQDHPNRRQEGGAEARDHAAPRHRQPPAATLESAGRLGEVLAAVIQQEVELVVALGADCVLAVEDGEPSERHAGPCAIRYNNDTQFDTPTISTSHSTFSCAEACNGMVKIWNGS